MEEQLAGLIAAALAFVGSHFALSHPLRMPLVRALGARSFQILYSLVALATFIWMVLAFRAVPPAPSALWNGQGDLVWAVSTGLTLIAAVLLAGSFVGNPALPVPNAKELAKNRPRGVFHVTRHPMMWSFALWSLAHLLVSPVPRVIVLTGAIGFLALVGALMQDRKKEVLMGREWQRWERNTSYWPRAHRLASAGLGPWLGGLALWLGATWGHLGLIGLPAGIWRWL